MAFDMRGREIKVGSTVAYPDRRGASLWMNVAKVVKIATRRKYEYIGGSAGYVYVDKPVIEVNTGGTVQRLDRVVVIGR